MSREGEKSFNLGLYNRYFVHIILFGVGPIFMTGDLQVS